MTIIYHDTEFHPTQPADIVRDGRSNAERLHRLLAMKRNLAESVGGVILAVVLGVAGAMLLAHGLAGGFRTTHHVKVTGGQK